ncbi:MAG: serine/threonine-protein kinase [Bryobacteraceae bacterium]
MPDAFDLVNSVVEEALDLPLGERDALVSARCGADQGLRTAVAKLLEISNSIDGFLEDAAAPLTEIRPGDVLGGRFHILEEIGYGGAGAAFLAEDSLGEVALKTPHPEMQADPRAIKRFLAEVRMARAVQHPNICPVFDMFTFDHGGGTVTVVTMKYLRGETLARRISRGPIPAGEAMRIARGIGAGIDVLHAEGIVHCDLKPDNIMLTGGPGGTPVPVIIDFGLAHQPANVGERGGSWTALAGISGSPDYMAPEQFRTAAVTKAADIYAFGLILFEMTTGMRPFPAEDLLPAVIRRTTEDAPHISDVSSSAPRAWDVAIARALSRDVSARPRSAADLIAEMERALATGQKHRMDIAGHCRHRASRGPLQARPARRR